MQRALEIRNGWVFSKKTDLLVFLGISLFALPFMISGYSGAWENGQFRTLWVLFFAIGTDVAHTHSTAFRLHLDPREWKNRKKTLIAVPVSVYLTLLTIASIFSLRTMMFVVMYQAIWHFVRQQIGWVSWTARHAGEKPSLDHHFDRLMIYNATLFPLLIWHTGLVAMEWWKEMSFVPLVPLSWIPALFLGHWTINVAYVLRQLYLVRTTRTINIAKYLVVLSTWINWYGSIVFAENILAFGISIALGHAIPYMILTYRHSKEALPLIRRWGVSLFFGAIFASAYLHYSLMHGAWPVIGNPVYLLPILSLSNWRDLIISSALNSVAVCHYVFDAFIWRKPPVDGMRAFP